MATHATAILLETANDRFKRRGRAWFWGGLMFATVAHFGLIRFFPELTAADFSFSINEFEAIELPPEVEIPPPPELIRRPALPVVATADLEEDITIAPTTFEENPVETLPPPPSDPASLADRPTITPYTVAPELKDPARAARIVEGKYPRVFQDAGIGGSVEVWAFIDADGVVTKALVKGSSGYEKLDEAALAAVREFQFRPAMLMDRHVPVWVVLPVTFRVDR